MSHRDGFDGGGVVLQVVDVLAEAEIFGADFLDFGVEGFNLLLLSELLKKMAFLKSNCAMNPYLYPEGWWWPLEGVVIFES